MLVTLSFLKTTFCSLLHPPFAKCALNCIEKWCLIIEIFIHELKSHYLASPPKFAHCGGGGGLPALPRKNDKNRGDVVGQNKSPILIFSNSGNQWWNNITMLNNAQSSLSIGFARDTILYILYNLMLRAILADYRWEKGKSESTFNSILLFC